MIASVIQQSDTTYRIITESGSYGASIYCPNGRLEGHTGSTVSILCQNENALKIFDENGNQTTSVYVPKH